MPTATIQTGVTLPTGASVPGLAVSLTYTAIEPGLNIPITGAATYTVDLAMMPATGLQGLQVSLAKVDAANGAVVTPVKVVFTNGFVWLPPGGALAIAVPGIASGGITSLQLVTTANALVTVTAMG